MINHGKINKLFRCRKCVFETRVKHELTRHQRTHIQLKMLRGPHNPCGYLTSKQGKLRQHILEKHKLVDCEKNVAKKPADGTAIV